MASPAVGKAYEAIDGKHLMENVSAFAGDLAQVSRRRPSAVLGPDHRHVCGSRKRAVADEQVQGRSGCTDVH